MRSRDARVIPTSAAKIASSHRSLCAKRGKPDTLIPPPFFLVRKQGKRERIRNEVHLSHILFLDLLEEASSIFILCRFFSSPYFPCELRAPSQFIQNPLSLPNAVVGRVGPSLRERNINMLVRPTKRGEGIELQGSPALS